MTGKQGNASGPLRQNTLQNLVERGALGESSQSSKETLRRGKVPAAYLATHGCKVCKNVNCVGKCKF